MREEAGIIWANRESGRLRSWWELFLTFEGIDGSGKTTQIELLCRRLLAESHPAMVVREPGGTRLGERIRKILLEHDEPVSAWAEFLLYASSRAQLWRQAIEPEIKKGTIILCDRYIDSSIAYQGYGLGMPIDALQLVNAWITDHVKPDCTLLLDINPGRAVSRRRGRAEEDRIEQRELEFHDRVRVGYLELAAAEPARIKVVDADRPVEEVAEDVWKHIHVLF